MANILLISCNLATSPYPVFPLGPAYIAGALTAGGHQVRQLDIQASGLSINEAVATIDEFPADLICLSIRNIDSTDSHDGMEQWFLDKARDVARVIRQVSSAPLVLGGAGFSLMPEHICHHLNGDFAIVGEGEKAIIELICALEQNDWKTESLPQIWKSSSLRGEEITCPAIDNSIAEFYLKKSGIMGVQSKRGCPYSCAYCSYPLLEGKQLRYMDPEMVAGHMHKMYTDHGVSEFVFCDSVFNDTTGHHLQVAEAIKACNIPIRWSGYFRPSTTTGEELSFLQSAGLYALEIGTDSASDTTLAAMRKPFTFDEVHSFSTACAERGLAQAHFVIMGGPEETQETALEGLQNLKKLEKSVVFVYQGVRILPGTHIEKRGLAEGIITAETSLLRPVYYHSPYISQAELETLITKDFAGNMTRVFPPSKANHMESALRSLGHKGLLWDKLLASKRKRKKKTSLPCHV